MATRGARIALVSGIVLALGGRALAVPNCRPRESKTPVASTYVGVAACASQSCHGSTLPRGESATSLQNEYITWYQHDRHARAHTVLESKLGQEIGVKLGIQPTTAERCLTCHSTYPRSDQPDTRCRIADGVTCESCHGAAGGWLEQHTEAHWTPEQSVKEGMKDTSKPEEIVETCLDCHLGDVDDEVRRVDHELLAVGHPPLAFELDSFAVNMPAHWTHREDKDGRPTRNERWFDGTAWAAGQVAAACRAANLFANQVRKHGWPDFALYDCQSCHHGISGGDWQLRGVGGRPPLDNARRPGMDALVRVFDGRTGRSAIADLAEAAAGGQGGETVDGALAAVRSETERLGATVRTAAPSDGRILALMRAMVRLPDPPKPLGFRSAQQAAWALDSLVDARSALAQDFDRKRFTDTRKAIQALYKSLDEKPYDPALTAQKLTAVGATLK